MRRWWCRQCACVQFSLVTIFYKSTVPNQGPYSTYTSHQLLLVVDLGSSSLLSLHLRLLYSVSLFADALCGKPSAVIRVHISTVAPHRLSLLILSSTPLSAWTCPDPPTSTAQNVGDCAYVWQRRNAGRPNKQNTNYWRARDEQKSSHRIVRQYTSIQIHPTECRCGTENPTRCSDRLHEEPRTYGSESKETKRYLL